MGRTRFGKYELVARLAKGGMGETFRAELVAAAGVTKQVVIKKMLPYLVSDAALVEAFVQEARLSASLSHANLAQVFDFGEVDGEYFIAMEYVDGRSLEKVLERARSAGWARLPFQLSAFIVLEVLKGLVYAHGRNGPDGAPLNLVHRDISPDNVLLGFEGEVKLVDFGVAKATMAGRPETEPGLVKGKFRYVSPEQAMAQPLDARSDLFTVGVVLYQLLTGELPYAGQQHTVMQAIVEGQYVRPRVRCGDIPEPLADVVRRAMETRREDRFASARAMMEPLSRWLYGQEPDFSGEVLRELMGNLFDAELLADGRLFVSHPGARAKLLSLPPSRRVDAVTQRAPKVPRPEVATTPGTSAVEAPVVAHRPALRLALAGVGLSLFGAAAGLVALDVTRSQDEPSTQQAVHEPPSPPKAKPKTAAPKVEVVDAPPPVQPAVATAPEVAFDAEAAPVTIRLTEAHQLVVPQRNCIPAERKWVLTPGRSPRVLPTPTLPPKSMSWSGPGRFNQPVPPQSFNSDRTLAVLALFAPVAGPVQTWLLDRSVSGAGPGQLCAFSPSDRSLEQESQPGSFKVNGVEKKLPRTLINVEPDDRFAVRAFAPGKRWVVRVNDVSPPWPVLVVHEGRDVVYVLDQHETVLDHPASAWLTVPVLERRGPYSREVAIQLAPGETLNESAPDLERLALGALERGSVGEAARVLDRCINAYPTYAPCHRLLGDAFSRLGYRDEARARYLEFLRLAPKDPLAAEVQKLVGAP